MRPLTLCAVLVFQIRPARLKGLKTMTVIQLIAILQTMPPHSMVTVRSHDGDYVDMAASYVSARLDFDYPIEPPAGGEWRVASDGNGGHERDIVNLIDLSFDPPR